MTMVYAPRRPSAIGNATRSKREALPGYQAAMDAIPAHHADAIRAYIASLHQEAAVQRTAAARARAALESRAQGDGDAADHPRPDPLSNPSPTTGNLNPEGAQP
ncbi:hypothetical protein [Microbacterium sp. LCT-H2]|uniref:hypothetical protein n=1 Tax=Microbacterium sp. LCT-H2 TaxID=1914306 RepID=UPI00115FD02E|nr:hypothetical protein [Microbacterium sp. LCT-H2]